MQPSPVNRLRPNVTQRGATPEEASSVYNGFYGEMPIPATAYAQSVSRLESIDAQPSVRTVASNASVVDRRNRRKGIHYTAGRQLHKVRDPQYNNPVFSSEFNRHLFGPQVNFVINSGWYIAYPAATVMLGGMHNLAWSTKVDQLPTRTSGGPGPAQMTPAPWFKSVQTVPRYSTMPTMYNTQSTDT